MSAFRTLESELLKNRVNRGVGFRFDYLLGGRRAFIAVTHANVPPPDEKVWLVSPGLDGAPTFHFTRVPTKLPGTMRRKTGVEMLKNIEFAFQAAKRHLRKSAGVSSTARFEFVRDRESDGGRIRYLTKTNRAKHVASRLKQIAKRATKRKRILVAGTSLMRQPEFDRALTSRVLRHLKNNP